MQFVVPRRHSAKTLKLLVMYYAGAGVIGMLTVMLIGAGFSFLQIEATPQRFALAMGLAAPVGMP